MTQHVPLSLAEVAALTVAERSALLVSKDEAQHFDRKSARISPPDLADALVGFANAEGGLIVVGIHNNAIEGVTAKQANPLLRAPIDFAEPPVQARSAQHECVDTAGVTKYVLAFEVLVDGKLHKNRAGEVFLRVGDSTKHLTALDAQELAYEKASPAYDTTVLHDATAADLDAKTVDTYVRHISPRATRDEALRARGLVRSTRGVERPTVAAVLLFGLTPQALLPQARVRVITYRGTTRETGTSMNVERDREFDLRITDQIDHAKAYIANHIPTTRRLDPALSRFRDLPLIPTETWEEALVNAVAHRSYSNAGDHIRVEIFTDRVEVTSPGRLPGMVTLKNIKGNHFARNPLLARVLTELEYMRETAEGVRRMFESMSRAGLPPPLLTEGPGSFTVTLLFDSVYVDIAAALPSGSDRLLQHLVEKGRVTTGEAQSLIGRQKPATIRLLTKLATDHHLIERVERGPRDPTGYWRVLPAKPRRRAGGG